VASGNGRKREKMNLVKIQTKEKRKELDKVQKTPDASAKQSLQREKGSATRSKSKGGATGEARQKHEKGG